MATILHSFVLDHIVALPVTVSAIPSKRFQIRGASDVENKESAVRIMSALQALGHGPECGATIALHDNGNARVACLDLPIALAVLMANGAIPAESLDGYMVSGELGFDGSIRAVRGTLAGAELAVRLGMRGVIVPHACEDEALMTSVDVYGVDTLADLVLALRHDGQKLIRAIPTARRAHPTPVDMAEVRGQPATVEAVARAASARQNILLVGPPGIGKTMLARRVTTVMPPMTYLQILETTRVYSALGLASGPVDSRPFRAPHHTVSGAALGGTAARPGELHLATNGALLLDELPEFSKLAISTLVDAIKALPETQRPLIIASTSLCGCGWSGYPERECSCTNEAVARYSQRVAGYESALALTRIEVPALPLATLRTAPLGETSASILARLCEPLFTPST